MTVNELSNEEIVINKRNRKIAVESTEYFDFKDSAERHTYTFEPSDDGYEIKEQVLIDEIKEQYVVGEIRKLSDNALRFCLADSLCNNTKEEAIIVSYDTDAIRVFGSPNTLIATIREHEEDEKYLAFEGTTMMKSKYVIETEQHFSKYMPLVAAVPYLDF